MTDFPGTDSTPHHAHHRHLFNMLGLAMLAAVDPSVTAIEIAASGFLSEATREILDRAPGTSLVVWSL
ncbi:MAG: hypothetical protein IT370_03110 [Deltaproteobacteria bacterium]|nr:hypothetical protein [Deltaproteobacteria bacterium]